MDDIKKGNKTLRILFTVLIVSTICLAVIAFDWQRFFNSDSVEKEKTFSEQTEQDNEEDLLTEPALEGEFEGIDYKVVRQGTIEHEFIKSKIYDIVTEETKKENIEMIAEQIIGEIIVADNDIDEIHFLFFSDVALIEIQPFDIAQAIWKPKEGEITPEIARDNLRDNYEIRVIMKNDETGE